jgi:g-D-glutamyl-meso-diaminopimelate peptidase
MRTYSRKSIVIITLVVVAVGVAIFVFFHTPSPTPVAAPVIPVQNSSPAHDVIGHSVQGRTIDAYTYGHGSTRLVFVGGIHGGYEWNSVLLAYTLMDYLSANPTVIPENESVTVIPSANPDGVFKVVGKEGRFTVADAATSSAVLAAGRFNADVVDLNRNFDCKWQPQGTWQSKTESAGTAAFSEPEAQAIRDFMLSVKPAVAVFWHSQADAVYASQCGKGILPVTLGVMNAYAHAAGYPAVKTFDAYATTGAADDWLSTEDIPAITVELSTHDSIEWDKNLKGIEALLGYFGTQ